MKLSKKLRSKVKTSLKRLFLVFLIILTTITAYIASNTKIKMLLANRNLEFHNGTEREFKLTDMYASLASESAAVTPKIVGGFNNFISLSADGKVYGWGDNSSGQLATGDTTNQTKPVFMGIDNAKDIAAGSYFTVVLKKDGTVWTVGNNSNGQLGNGTEDSSSTFVQVKTETGKLENIKAVAAGDTFAFAITNSNEVYGWGYNGYGQLGVGDTTQKTVATKTQFTGITQISAGENHTIALDTNGAVWGVGYNNFGQLGLGNRTNQSIPKTMLASGAKEVATGKWHTAILKTDGTVWVTGHNGNAGEGIRYYVLGLGGSGSGYRDTYFSYNGSSHDIIWKLRQMKVGNASTVIADGEHITANGYVTYVTSQSGGMYTAGSNKYGALFRGNATMNYFSTKVQTSKTITNMAVTRSGNTGAYADNIGRIYTVGYSAQGQLGNSSTATSYGYIPYDISDYKFLVTPSRVTMQKGNTQNLNIRFSTGLNLANSTIKSSIELISLDETVATVSGTTVKAVGEGTTYIRISDSTNAIYGAIKIDVTEEGNIAFAKVVGGNNYFISLKSDGTVWAWGANNVGQLGFGDNVNKIEPQKTNLTNVVDIAAGASFSAVLKNDGTVWTTGDNTYGQLGDTTEGNRNTFKQVVGLTNVIAIVAENNTMHVLKDDGTVWSWGLNSNGQFGNQSTENSTVPVKVLKVPNIMQISGGANHLIMQGANGSVWGTGYNAYGQLGLSNATNQTIPQRMLGSGAKEVATGANHTVVLKNDGTVWGTGYQGDTNVGNRYYILPLGASATGNRDATTGTISYIHALRQLKGGSANTYITGGKHITASANTTYVTTDAAGVYTFGQNNNGVLFTGNTTMSYWATQVQTGMNVVAMGATRNGSTGTIVDQDGMVYTVGLNSSGQLGNGTIENLTGKICISKEKITPAKKIINFENSGDTEQITYTTSVGFNLLHNELQGTECTFTTLDETVATVDSTGKVTAVATGTTYVKLYNAKNAIYESVKINVNGNGNMSQAKIVGGGNHFVALKGDGTVWTWGLNDVGQLGVGDLENRTEPTKTNMKNVIDIAAGYKFTALLRKDGTVWTAGYNNNGQLGDGTNTSTESFHKVRLNDNGDYLENVIQITAENETMHALTSDGEVYSWGRNTEGQFGNATVENSNYPVKMLKISNVSQISGGAYHLVMVLADSSVWSVGYNKYGQLGLGHLNSQNLPQRILASGGKEVATGANHTVVLKTDGTVWSAGFNGNASASNNYYVLGLGGSGSGYYNGNISGDTAAGGGSSRYIFSLRQVKLGSASANITDGKHITSSGNTTYVTTNAGGMYTFGQNGYGGLFNGSTTQNYWATQVQKNKTVVAMAITRNSATGAIADQDGMVYSVGYNGNGEIGNGTTENLSVAVCISNKKINVDKNIINFQKPGETENIKYSTGMTFNLLQDTIPATDCTYTSLDETVATVDNTGKVTAVGTGSTFIKLYNEENAMYAAVKINVNEEGNTTFPKIVGGGNHFVALKANGSVYTWGINTNGELGTGDNSNKTEPTKAKYAKQEADGKIIEEDLTDIIDIAAGYNFSLALKKDGTVWATGINTYGQLGNGTVDSSNLFVQVKGENGVGYLKDVIQIAAGNNTSHALMSNGQVYSWGLNSNGQFGNATKVDSYYPTEIQKVSNVIQISAGANHLAMLLSDSSVWTVGNNTYGQLGLGHVTSQSIPQRMLTSGAKEIATGANHTVVLKTDGTVWVTGFNGNGNAGNYYYILGLGGSGSGYYDGSLSSDTAMGGGTSRYIFKLRQVKLEDASINITDGKHITASGNATYVTSQTSGMYTFGQNSYGGLFTNSTDLAYWARYVQKDKTILTMATTRNSATGAIADQDGMVYTVGYNKNGEMGNGTTENLSVAVCISDKKINVDKNIINFEKAGDTDQITYTTSMAFNLIQDSVPGTLQCTFKSLDESIATVNENGVVTAVDKGTTYVQLHNAENAMYSTVKINVNGEGNITQPKIVGGGNHFVALKAKGTVYTWGLNSSGQLGTGDNNNRIEPAQAKYAKYKSDGTIVTEDLTDIIDVAAGYNFTLALKKDGTVWAAGLNDKGQLGNGTTQNSNLFVQVKYADGAENLKNIIQITAENETAHALSKSGNVFSWGRNTEGQFGNSTTTNSSYPVQMLKVTNVMQISAGAYHSVMLLSDSSVWSVGHNKYGQLGLGHVTSQSIPQRMLASGAKEVTTGANHTVVLKTDGTVWSVGFNGNSSAGNDYYVLGLGGNGTNYREGYISSDTAMGGGSSRYIFKLRQVKLGDANTNLTGGKHVTAGGNATYVTTNDGGMYTFGQNSNGVLFRGNTTQNYWATKVQAEKTILTSAITKNGATGAIADTDGLVYTVGYNKNGEMGNGDTVNLPTLMCISQVRLIPTPLVINYAKAGDTGEKITYTVTAGFNLLNENVEQGTATFTSLDESVATVDETGVVTATGLGTTNIRLYNDSTDTYTAIKVNVSGDESHTYPKIVAGANHFAALRANGEIWTWGYNNYGQLGLGNETTTIKPAQTSIYDVNDETQNLYAIDVAAGSYHTLILKSDGTVWAAGYNKYGQLGDGTTNNSNTFIQVKNPNGDGYLQNIKAITANNFTSYALSEDGTVYAWGYNGNGNLGINAIDTEAHSLPIRMSKVTNIMQIAAGNNHVVMVRADGTVWGVGYNEYGQLGLGNNTKNVTVAAQMKNSAGTGYLTGVKQVSCGSNHTLIALENGKAQGVGYNKNYQLGVGDRTNRNLPVAMTNTSSVAVTNIKSVLASGNSSILSVKETTTTNEDGTTVESAGIYVTGYNNYGQLFTKDATQRTRLQLVQTDKNVITMATTTNSSYQTSAIADDYGLVYTVGYNAHGEMGDDTITSTVNPVSISEAFLEIEKSHLILNLDSSNSSEQIKAATTLGFNLLYYKVEDEEIKYESLDENISTVNEDGVVTGKSFGTTKVKVVTNKLPNRVFVTVDVLRKDDVAMPKIVNGSNFSIALRADGTVWSWGLNSSGQLGLGDTSTRYKPTKLNISNIIDIAAGDTHALLLTKDGEVYSFGSNGYNQLGRTGTTNVPMKIEGLQNIVEIVATTYGSMALNNQGQVYTWGYNGKGQIGDETTANRVEPIKIKLNGILTIDGFNQTAAAVSHDGELYVWGYNRYGQLGLGNTNDRYSPTLVGSLSGIVDVAVENNAIVALDENGVVWTSGRNNYGQLGNNTTSTRYTFGKVLDKNGEVLTNVKAIEAGNEYVIAMKNDGTAVGWGLNNNGQLTTGNTSNVTGATVLKYSANGEVVDKIFDVAAGAGTTAIVRVDGKVWTVGANNYGQMGDNSVTGKYVLTCITKPQILVEESPIRIKGINKTQKVETDMICGFNLLYSSQDSVKYEFTMKNPQIATVSEDGTVTSAKKGKTQLTITETVSGEKTSVDVYVLGDEDITFAQIEARQYSTVTLKANGEVWSYGRNNYGQLGTGDNYNKILPTYTGINNILQISLGETHCLAVDTEGHVWSWGYNNYGQLGNNTTTTSYSKVQVKSPDGEGVLEDIIAVAAGNGYSLALDKNGKVYSWGYNNNGQLGLGDTAKRSLPVLVQSLENIIKIEAGRYSSFAIDNNNNLWVAGYNGYGNLGDGTTTNRTKFVKNHILQNVTEVAVGETNNTLVLTLDGIVWGFGNNTNNALANASGAIPQQISTNSGILTNVTAIHAGYQTGYAITADEKVVSWGTNSYAQLATGNTTKQTVATYMKDKNGNDFTDVMLVSGGRYHTEIAKNDGTVWSIGYNGYGELGDGSSTNRGSLVCISIPHVVLEEREVTLKLSDPNYQINPTTEYGYNLLYDEVENNGFKYESSNTNIATVDINTGLVKAKNIGRTYVTVTSNDGESKTRVVIDVIGEENKTKEKVATGNIHSLALKQNGTIWAWGDNSRGEIGNGVANAVRITKPTQIVKGIYDETEKELDNIVDIAAGYYYNLALDSNGNVLSWGYNGYGQLGNGTTTNINIPTKIAGLEKIKKVFIRDNTSMAINEDGEIFIWGQGYEKTPTKINFYSKAIDLSENIILAEDGTVWSLSTNPNKVAGLKNIVQIASEDKNQYALDANGKVYAWGYNNYGQLGQGHDSGISGVVSVPVSNVVEIATGRDNLLMTTKDGKIYSCGRNGNGQLGVGNYTSEIHTPTEAVNINNNKLMSSDYYHSVISDQSGFVYTTGLNQYGELGNETFTNRNTYSVIGDTFVYVNSQIVTVEKEGTFKVTASLNNEFNLIQDVIDDGNIEYTALNEDIAVIDTDGTITGKQYGKAEIVARHKLTNKTTTIFVNVVPDNKVSVPEVENSYTHSAALKADGTVWTWGSNTYGQLGIGSKVAKSSPVQVTGLEDIIDISVGYYNTIAVKRDGTVWSFGLNTYGQLGEGTATEKTIPTQVLKSDGTALDNIVKVAGGKYKTVALDLDGNVWIWGYKYSKTATKLTTVENIVDISMTYAVDQKGNVFKIQDGTKMNMVDILRVSEGENHTLFLRKDGKGYAIGGNTKGQLGIGTTKDSSVPVVIKDENGTKELNNIKELKAGKEFSMALANDGTTYVWGSNENYKLATTQETNQVIPKKNTIIPNGIFIEAGIENGLVINEEGYVYAWGLGTNGTIGNKLYETTSEPVMVGREDVVLDNNNIVLNVGDTHQINVQNKTFNVIKNVVENSIMDFITENSNIASVTQSGEVKGLEEGKTLIVVNKQGTSYSRIAQVTVLPEGVNIEPMALTNGSHAVVLKADGSVWSYGVNSSYELGNGTTKTSDTPVRVQFPEGVVIKQIAVGNTHNLALDVDGNVWGWGVNSNNALSLTASTPKKLGLSKIKKVVANNDQSMALTEDGYVYVWGLNSNGELGTRTYEPVKEPTQLTYVNDILDIAIGRNHTLLLTEGGKVLTSGSNLYGQTAKTDGKSNVFEEIHLDELVGRIAAGDNHSVLLTVGGEVYTFGYNVKGQLGSGDNKNITTPTKVSGISNIMQISAGKNQTIVLSSDRRLYSTGSNAQGELGIGNNEDKARFTEITAVNDFMSISCGNTYNVAIKYDGDVYGWGDYYHGLQKVKTKTNSRIPVKIGNDSSYASEPEITLSLYGTKQINVTPKYTFNVYKEDEIDNDFKFTSLNENIATVDKTGKVTGLGVGITWVKATEVSSGKENVVIVKVTEEGQKYYPQVAGGENYAAVLKADGSIWSFGYNSDGQLGNDKLVPVNVPSQTNILATYKKVVAGKAFTMALREDGTIWAWGDNTYGVLGQGNRSSAKKPIQVQGIDSVVDIAVGENHVIAIDIIGNVYTWGLNSSGQLGNGKTKTETMPQRINAIENQIISIAAGGNMTAFVDSEGRLYVFGEAKDNYYTKPQLISEVTEVVKVGCMQNDIIVLRRDGSMVKLSGFGDEIQVQELSSGKMVDISAKHLSAMTIDVDGNMYTYGNNTNGQSGLGTITTYEDLQQIDIVEGKTYLAVGAAYENNYVIDVNGFVYASGSNEYGQLGNSLYEDSNVFTLVGDRKFEIVPDARTMAQPEEETVSVITNVFNTFNHNTKKLTDFDWTSNNTDVATVEDGVITSQDMGTAIITATDKQTGATAEALRVVQPLDEQRIDSIYVNGVQAKLVGENKYGLSVAPNLDGTGLLKIVTRDNTDSISIDQGTTYTEGGVFLDTITLDTDPTIVKIRVKTTNEKTVDFILTIDVVSNEAGLLSLTVDGENAKPTGTNNYEIVIPNEVDTPEVIATANHEAAKVSIENSVLELKQTTKKVEMGTKIKKVVPIQVVAEDGNSVEYILTIYKEDALTELETVTVNGKEASKISKDTYKTVIASDLEKAEVSATTLYPSAEVQINNLGQDVNVTTRTIATTENQTIVKIYVTEGEKEREFTLIIEKETSNTGLELLSLSVNGTDITPVENVYEIYLPESTTSAEVTAITLDNNNLVSIGDNESEVHTTTKTVEVNGNTTYKITVTDPEDSENKYEYILNIKMPSSDNTLKALSIGNSEFLEEAKRIVGTNIYEVSIPEEYLNINVIAETNSTLANVSVDEKEFELNKTIREIKMSGNPTEITVKVKAQDGTEAEYILKIYQKNGNTNLLKVTVDGEEVVLSATEKNTYEYTLDKVADTINVGAIAEESRSSVAINANLEETHATHRNVEMIGRSIVVTITVIAEDGTSEQYKLIVNSLPDNVRLLNVKVNGKEATAVPTNKYEAKVNKNDTSFELYVIPEDQKAKVQIETNTEVQGTASASIDKTTEERVVKIKVTAQDGTEQEYTLVVTNESDVCDLATIKVDGELILPNPEDGKYYVSAKYLTESVNVEATASSDLATVSINSLEPTIQVQRTDVVTPDEINYINVTVTAEDGTQNQYTIVVEKLPNNTNAEMTVLIYDETGSKVINVVTFDEKNTAEVKIGNNNEATIEAILQDNLATVSIDGELPVKATASKIIETTEEKTVVNIEVIAQDGTQKNYVITLLRYSDDNTLLSLEATGIESENIVKTSDTSYTIEMPDTKENIELIATANNEFARVLIEDGEFSDTNKLTRVVEMPNEIKVITIVVRAENGDEKQYEVTIKKVVDLSLTSVKVDDVECEVKDNTYIAFVDSNVTEVTLDIIPANPKVLLSTKSNYDGEFSVPESNVIHTKTVQKVTGEDTIVLIKVEDENDSTRTKTYTVVIKEKSHNAEIEIIKVDGKDAIELSEKYYAETGTYSKEANLYIKAKDEFAKVEIIDVASSISSIEEDITLTDEKVITVQIRITAQDGIIFNDYILEIERKSDDTSCAITVNGLVPDKFDSETNTYTKYVERTDTEATITVNTTSAEATIELAGVIQAGALSATVDIPEEENKTEIIVKAENGNSEVYYVNIVKNSEDATIETVKVNNVVIEEVDGVYTAIIFDNGDEEQNAAIEVTSTNENAKIQIGEGTEWLTHIATSNVTFKDGNRVISLVINVQAQDSATEMVTKQLDIKLVTDDVSIKSVKNVDTQVKYYDASTHTYTEYVDKEVEEVTLAIEANNVYTLLETEGSSGTGVMSISNIDVKDKDEVIIKFTATAETGRTQEYTIIIRKKSDNANAAHIYIDGIDIIDKFENVESVPTYVLSIEKLKDISQIRVISENEFAQIQIGDEEAGLADITRNVKLPIESNSVTVPIVIVSQDGKVTKTYNVIFVRIANNTKVAMLTVNDKQIVPDSEGNYEVTVKASQELAKIDVFLDDILAKVTLGGNVGVGHISETTILANTGDTVKTITITAQDGTVVKHKLTIHKQVNDLTLDEVKVDGESATKIDDNTFTIFIPKGTDTVNIEAIAHKSSEYVSIAGNKDTISSNTYVDYDITNKEITIVVKAMFNNDGVQELDEQREYKLKITQENLVGKVITQAVDQNKQSATIIVYRTDDTRLEDDPVDPREIVTQVEINPDGSYALELEEGTYDLVVKKLSYLEYRLTGIEVVGQVELEDIEIFAGDIILSGQIEIDDLVNLNDKFGITITPPSEDGAIDENTKYDLNEDGVVNYLDRNILKGNYGKKNETVEWVNPNIPEVASFMMINNEDVQTNSVTTKEKETKDFIVPMSCSYTITSEYGTRTHPVTGEVKKHTGIDLGGTHHTEIFAVADGEVTFSGVQNGFGNCVEIKHVVNGETIYSFYAHLSKIDVQVGEKVTQGQVIGLEGGDPDSDPNPGYSTGHHLHFEIRNASGYGNDIDPTKYIRF